MNTLDKFGKFIVDNLRDKSLDQYNLLQQGKLRAAKLQEIQTELMSLSESQKKLIEKIIIDTLDTAMHDFLFAFQDAHDRGLGIDIIVDGENIAETSGMLNGEHCGKGGWIDKFSRFTNF